jgi:hypothetical protein
MFFVRSLTGWTQKCYWKLKFIKCFYINDYFPGMALSWYWGLNSILMNMGYTFYKQIMMTNTDIDIGRIVSHHYLYFLFITILEWLVSIESSCWVTVVGIYIYIVLSFVNRYVLFTYHNVLRNQVRQLRQLTITNIQWLKLTNEIVRFLQNMYLNDLLILVELLSITI